MKPKELVVNARKPEGYWGEQMIASMNEEHYELTGWGLGFVDIHKQDQILDVGCGGGMAVQRMAALAEDGRVFGVDYSELSVEKASFLNRDEIDKGKVTILPASVSNLPFPDGQFDLVTGIETFYFWPDPIGDLKEVYRVLKKGGRILLVFEIVYCEENPEKWKTYEEWIQIKAPSKESLTEQLMRAGYRNISVTINERHWMCAVAEK